MTNVTVIADDKAVSVNFKKHDGIDYAWPANLWAIQWDGTKGQIEYRDNTVAPATLTDVQPYIDLFNAHDDAMYQANKSEQMATDAASAARGQRNSLIADTDWWASSDLTMTQAQLDYRQALRDLPSSSDWNPVMSWVDSDADRDNHYAELTGVTWPTKP